MGNYQLAASFGRANVQDRLWYVQNKEDLEAMKQESSSNLVVGDKAWVIDSRELYIYDFNKTWVPM